MLSDDTIGLIQSYDPYAKASNPLEAMKIHLQLIEDERSNAFRGSEVDSSYFLEELQDAGIIIAALSNPKYQDDFDSAIKDLRKHFKGNLDTLEILDVLVSGDYSQLIW